MATNTVTCPNCSAEEPEVLYDDDTAEAVPTTDIDTATNCSECYTNPDCPDACNEPHEAPSWDRYCAEWECPTTGTAYRYCEECGWEYDPYNDGPVRVHGAWYCSASNHDIGSCERCEGYMHYEDMHYNRNDIGICGECYENGGNSTSADDNRYVTCALCRKSLARQPLLFDTETEHTYCTDHDVPSPTMVLMVAA